MAIVAHTLLDLVKNLKSFGGILIVSGGLTFYFIALSLLLHGHIPIPNK